LVGATQLKSCGYKQKTPSAPGKTENEGIQRILPKTVRQAGLILLFDGEVARDFPVAASFRLRGLTPLAKRDLKVAATVSPV